MGGVKLGPSGRRLPKPCLPVSLFWRAVIGYASEAMVDIHCHILPGLDDGPDSFEESVQMAEMAIADGITHVVATPHANSMYVFDPAAVKKLRDELQEKVGDRLQLATGCDFHLSFENLQDIAGNTAKYAINQKRYLLVEFAEFAIPPSMDDTLHQLQLLGLSVIITHPERNRLIRAHQDRLRGWLHQGCYVQITAQSLVGQFGPNAQKEVEQWLDQEMVHFIASDAHSITRRPLKLREAYDAVSRRRGEEVARALLHDNPLAAFEGRTLPYEPEQPEVAARSSRSGRRKRFIFF
jgi:protein-tyrosine phosphatase